MPPFEDETVVQQYYDALIEGKELQYYKISTGLNDTENLCGQGRGQKGFPRLPSKRSGEVSKYGSPLYTLGTVSLYDSAQEEVFVKAPEGSTVYINGVALDESYCTESGIETASCAHMPDGVKGVTYRMYQLGGLLNDPEVSVRNRKGLSIRCRMMKLPIPIPQDWCTVIRFASIGDYVKEAAQALAAYMQMDSYFGAVQNIWNRERRCMRAPERLRHTL